MVKTIIATTAMNMPKALESPNICLTACRRLERATRENSDCVIITARIKRIDEISKQVDKLTE